jgi:5-methylcytosine-specific restriction endonuclease McrA
MNAIDSALTDTSGFIGFFVEHPSALLVIALVIAVILITRAVRRALPVTKDDQRLFTSFQKQETKRRAGMRCEHSALGFRCSKPGEHADHVYPHSKGGMTAMSNCQSLCAPHNLRKSAQLPSKFYMLRLEKRRAKYFPEGVDPRVEWRQGRSW